jgi:hypothetical protein
MTSVPQRSAEMIWTGLALGALALIAPASATRAQGVFLPQVQNVISGLFCAPPEGGRRDAPDTVSGWTHVPDQPIEILVQSRLVPAVLGQGFGVVFDVGDIQAVSLRYEVTHPPMPPTGATRQGWAPDGPALGGGGLFFQFDEPEELVTGTWVFHVLVDEVELLQIDFEVVPAAEAPHLTGLCAGTLFSSLIP